ncbi:unnamed protein product [Ranitomeya imitator]|uniref:Reverse transcriptase domain-containing protein n=1 Tax=Ranitomeya imitator TaxID=111125 RepID=A0ABN9MQG6_9NEOB|nr:unnamed protein product [Ranitomeya imitator]
MLFNMVSYGQAEADEIISQVKIPGEFLHTPVEEIRSRDWERELRKKTSLELHYVTLAEYHKVKRIPRGLWVSLRPTLFQEKQDFCTKFEGILNKCSMDIMLLTIEYLQKEISEMDKQIEVIQQQLSNTLTNDKFDSLKQKIDKTMEEFRNVLQERKRSKFLRDTEDYHRRSVYRWRDTNVQRDRRQYRRDFFTTSSSSDNDSSSRATSPFLEQRRGRDQLVYNISFYNLSPSELTVLQKGLSFYPTPAFNGFQLDQELQRFFRNLRLKAHFATGDSGSTFGYSALPVNPDKSVFSLKELDLTIPSKYSPPKSYHPVETYISLVTQDIKRESAQINQGSLPIKRNCTTLDKQALDNLKKNSSITIKPADKGGTIVVMDTSFYLSMVHQHLDDKDTYLPLDRDPSRDIFREIQQVVKLYREQNVIDTKLSEFLLNLHTVVPVFYALPKIQKHRTTIEKILTPLLVHVVSFIRDTSDFLEGLKSIGNLHKNCFLVTMDVNSLYTSIDHQKGLEAVQWFLDKYTNFSSIQKEFCLTLLNMILTKNFFLFGDQFYIQKVGTAMGSNVAPPYANIFMTSFEEHFVYTHCLFQQYCIYWKRYIDDVFLIWGVKRYP